MDSDGDGKISYDDFVLQFDSLAGGLPGGEDDDLLDEGDYPPAVWPSSHSSIALIPLVSPISLSSFLSCPQIKYHRCHQANLRKK